MSLHVKCGPMKSQKTTTLLHELNTYGDVNNCDVLIINHPFDTRNQKDGISSHSSMYQGLSSRLKFVSSDTLASINVDDYHMIGVDEAQFYGKDDLVNTVKDWLKSGKHVSCSGLNGSFEMKKFGYIHKLLPMADEFIKLNAFCDVCNNELLNSKIPITPINQVPAPFTKKIAGTNNLVEIGDDNYISVCRKHYYA